MSGPSGSGQAATILRNGTLILTSNTSLSGSTLQLGDATYQLGSSTYNYLVPVNVDYATAGASLLGVENSYSFIADNRNALGGVFKTDGNGTVTGTGSAIAGPGAFYNISAVIGATNIVTDAFAHSATLASSFGLNTTIITLGAGSTSTLFVGTQISGAGIAPGTVISQILSSTQFSISQATTADGTTPVNLTYTGLSTRILVKDEVNNPERNGIYQLAQVNADGTMNLVRTPDFSTTANMKYGTQVTVTSSPTATTSTTYFMAAHSVGTVNGTGTDPVYWLQDSNSPSATLTLQPAVTAVTQNIDLFANSNSGTSYYGSATINASSPVTFSGNVTLQNLLPSVQETHYLTLNSTATGTATIGTGTVTGTGMVFSGVISEVQGGFAATADQLQVNLSGTGVVTLSGANTYHGGTNVNGGTLLVNNTSGSGTGHGDVYVGSGAVLAGTGTIAVDASHNVAIDTGATLATGNPGTSALGTAFNINLGTGSILAIAGTLNLNLFSNSHGVNSSTAVDSLVITGAGGIVDLTGQALDSNSTMLTPGGTAAMLTVHNVNPLTTTFNAGDSFQLINWGGLVPNGTFTNLTVVAPGSFFSQDFTDLPALSANQYWNLANLYTLGTITVAVPEPSRVWLLLLGLLGMGLRRRRCSMW
jgi:autotransporter-associated beta strand protein